MKDSGKLDEGRPPRALRKIRMLTSIAPWMFRVGSEEKQQFLSGMGW